MTDSPGTSDPKMNDEEWYYQQVELLKAFSATLDIPHVVLFEMYGGRAVGGCGNVGVDQTMTYAHTLLLDLLNRAGYPSQAEQIHKLIHEVFLDVERRRKAWLS